MTARTARKTRGQWWPRFLALVLVAGGLGCAQPTGFQEQVTTAPPEKVDSPLGNYLAGRYARATRDTRSAAEFYTAALAEDPGNSNLQHRTFLLMLAEGEITPALKIAHELLADENTAAMAEILLAVDAIRQGHYVEATGYLGEPPERGFGALLKPLILAWTAVGEGNRERAMAMLKALDGREAFAAFRNYHTALILDYLGDTAAAREAYAKFREEQGVSTSSALAHGSFLRRQGDTDDAEAVYGELLDRAPDNPAVAQALADLKAGRPAQPYIASVGDGVAEALYGASGALARERGGDAARIYAHLALYLRPDFDSAQVLLGEILDLDRRWDDAIKIYRKVAKSSPYHDETRIRIATNLDRLGRVDEAIKVLKAVNEDKPDDTVAIITLADLLRAHERYGEAAAAYDRAIAQIKTPEERHWALFYARGVALERSKQWKRAEADFLKALQLKPDHPLVLNYLGYSWVEQGRNLDKAQKMIEKAVEQRPNDGYIVDSLGWVLYRLKDYKGAVKNLERAVELKPEDPVINDHLGDAFWRVGRHLEARFQWRHALGLEPDKSEIPKLKAKLERGLTSIASNNGAS